MGEYFLYFQLIIKIFFLHFKLEYEDFDLVLNWYPN
jgi:hypothetical protein